MASRGQSETLDTLTLIAVILTLSIAIGTMSLAGLNTTSSPLLDVGLEATTSTVTIGHSGGDSINVTTHSLIFRGRNGQTRIPMDNATISGDGDLSFETGEELTASHGLSDTSFRVIIIHRPTNAIIVDEAVDVRTSTVGASVTSNQLPIAAFSYSPANPSAGKEIRFDASSSSDPDGTVTGYEWDWTSDGTYDAMGKTANHTYNSTGSYTITLRVSDDHGATDTATVTISITNYAPTASFTYSPPSPGTAQTITFNASASNDTDGNITSYEWDWTSDGTYDATGETANHSYGTIGDKTVTLRVTDDSGVSVTTSEVVTVNLNQAPTPSFNYSPSNPTTGQTITFNASASNDPDGNITSYEWDWTNDGTYDGTGVTANHSYGSAGTYTVKLKVTDDLGSWNTTTASVTVSAGVPNQPPVARFAVTAVDWYSTEWSNRKPIELNHRKVPADQTNFPVLIDITDADLKADAQTDGDDILFTNGDGTTKLAHEIEEYDGATGDLVAWVKVPRVNSTTPNTTIYLYYNNSATKNQENPSGVWSNGYAAVHHLEESSGTVTDSTENANDGTNNGAAQGVTGKVGPAYDFENSDSDYVDIPTSSSLNVSYVHYSAWVESETFIDNMGVMAKGDDSNRQYWLWHYSDPGVGGPTIHYEADEKAYKKDYPVLSTNTWYKLDIVYDGSTTRAYLNGSLRATHTQSTGEVLKDDDGFQIGQLPGWENWDGLIDEVRVRDGNAGAVSSDAWVATAYNSTNDPSTFHRLDGEEEAYPASVNASASYDSDGSITSYEWDWTDDGTYEGTGETATHSYGSPGSYTIELKLTDDDGATNTTTEQVSITAGNAVPNASFNYSPENVEVGETVTFDGSASSDPDGSISTYEWDWTDDGSWDATGETATHEYADNGTYTVELRVTDNGSKTATATRTLTVSPTTFVDETSSANLGSTPGGGAIVFSDLDRDGFLDVLMNDDGYNSDTVRLRANDGDLTFTDRDDRVDVSGGRGAGTGDVDSDDDPDLIIGVGQRLNNNTGSFTFDTSTVGSANNEESLMFVDIDGDGDLDVWSPGEDYLWHEQFPFGWTSRDTMVGDGVNRTANGEGATAVDLNDDGFIDLLWAQGRDDVDVFVNQGNYSYTHHWDANGDFGLPENVGDHENMEWAWGDYDTDGDMDLFISGADNEGLYENDGTGSFTEVTSSAGISVTDPDGAAWGDYDNDGDLDLVVSKQGGTSKLYRNDGGGSFTDVAASANIGESGDLGSTIGWFDADNDGDLDLVTNDPATLWNNTRDDGEFLRVLTSGKRSPNTPIGAQVDVYENGTGTLVGHREVLASQNQLQPPLRQHFGVDPTASYDVRVRFPSGEVVWRNATVPTQENVSVGGTTLANTIRVNETGPLFVDRFNRADSDEVAFGWVGWEVEDDDARIQDNRMDFEPDDNEERPAGQNYFVKQDAGKIRLNFTMNAERTSNEQYYSINIQLGDGSDMIDPQLDHDQGVAVNLKWGGNEGTGVSNMSDEEGFGYTLNGGDTQIGVVSGKDGLNSGGNATVSVTVDLDSNTYNITVSGPGLVSGSGTATDVAFDNDVDIDTVRVFLDEVNAGNFDDLELDDITVERVDS